MSDLLPGYVANLFDYISGLKITAGHRTMTGQKCLLTGHFFTSPVILTGHICMPSDRILNRFFSSAYLLKSCQRKTVYFMASTQFHCKYVKLRTTKTLFVLVQNVNICWLRLKGFDFVLMRLFTVC